MNDEKINTGDLENEARKKINGANILFLGIVMMNIFFSILFSFVHVEGYLWNVILGQSVIVIPVIVYFIVTRQNFFKTIRMKKVNILTILMVIVFAAGISPIMSLINLISQLFVSNTTSSLIFDVISRYGLLGSLALIALTPALVEEVTFRGIIYSNYRKKGILLGIIISGLVFGAMHMNFNQFAYAAVLGMFMALVVEVTDSIAYSMIIHFCINGSSVFMVWLLLKLYNFISNNAEMLAKIYGQEQYDSLLEIYSSSLSLETTKESLLSSVPLMLIMAVIGTAVAGLMLYLIAKYNKRMDVLETIFKGNKKKIEINMDKKNKVRIVNIPFIIAIIICLVIAIRSEFFL